MIGGRFVLTLVILYYLKGCSHSLLDNVPLHSFSSVSIPIALDFASRRRLSKFLD